MDFSLSMLFPFLAALANALYQIATRLLHRADLPVTTLFYKALAEVLFLRRIAALCRRPGQQFCPEETHSAKT
jgi:hypothetical protein